jgi:UDP-galactopyranose mutase
MFDYLVVGAGFSGAVLAERLARGGGRSVLLIDRRDHLGGNAHDRRDEQGLLIHRYGPHIFHTNSREVFAYLSRFTAWRSYEHRVLAAVNGMLLPLPINLDTVNRLYGLSLTPEGLAQWFAAAAESRTRIVTAEDAVVAKVGRGLYEAFFRGYTRKQWGLDASELDASVTARLQPRCDRDDRYFTDSFQAMPLAGYTRLFENLVDHPGIRVQLGCDHRQLQAERGLFRELIYTGPIDAFFDQRFGPLPYRSLEFRFETRDCVQHQPVGTVNYPNDHQYTRITEFKHLTGQQHPRTTIVYEHPRSEGEPYYPIPRAENQQLYRRYHQLALATPGVHFCGRLATYRYYNMDQVVAQALTLAERLLAAAPGARP